MQEHSITSKANNDQSWWRMISKDVENDSMNIKMQLRTKIEWFDNGKQFLRRIIRWIEK